jgi:hypothetical protein
MPSRAAVAAVMSVTMKPGATALMVTPKGPSSMASVLVNGGLAGGLLQVQHGDRHVVAGQPLGGHGADAARPAGYDRDTSW